MPPNLVALLRRLADEYESEEKGEASKATEDRIAALEARLADASPAERREALEDLDDDERQLIADHRAAKNDPPEPKPDPKAKPKPEEKPAKRTRPGRKSGAAYNWFVNDDGTVERTDIPVVFNGEDEPDEVELPDEPEAAADAA